jgi:hypothetical protein
MRSLRMLALFPAALVMLPAAVDDNGNAADHNMVVPRTASAAFTANGIRSPDNEYSTAAGDFLPVGGSNFLEGKVFLNRFRQANGTEELRVYFSIHDISPFGNDRVEIYLDRLHNHGANGSAPEAQDDSVIRIPRADCTGNGCVYKVIGRVGGLFSGTGRNYTPSTAQVIANSAGSDGEYSVSDGVPSPFDHGWTGEVAIHPSDFGWASFPPLVGVLVVAVSGDNNGINAANGTSTTPPRACWPAAGCGGAPANAPLGWGHIKLRYPIDYALSLDNSGSMLALDGTPQDRWTRAKRAADLFVATLGLFRSDLFDDRVSVSQYSWDCFNDGPSGNKTGAVSGVTASAQSIPLPPPSGSFLQNNTTGPAGNNCTPIKDGLDYALSSQLGPMNPRRDRIVLLMSDGFHNTPNSTVPGFNNDPASYFGAAEKQVTQVRTVALGPDGSAGSDLLHKLSVGFAGGLLLDAKFNQVTSFQELLSAYLESLQAPLSINRVDDAAPPPDPHGSFTPGLGSADRMVFIGVWNVANQASALSVKRNSDAAITGTIANKTIGYAAVTVDQPTPGGTWTFSSASEGTMPDQRFVLVDMRVEGRVLIPQQNYAVGELIMLQLALTDRGQGIAGQKAAVEIFRPGEGLGNYLSVIQDDCSQGKPDLKRGIDLAVADRSTRAGIHATNAGILATAPDTTDPRPGRYALAAAWFAHCKKTTLLRDSLPGVKLYDDGTHGDPAPDDGVYTLAYTGTGLEGTYTFRFHAEGKTSDNVEFTRTRTVSQYFGVHPKPTATAVTLVAAGATGPSKTVLVNFLPRDNLGNYLGPGFGPSFAVKTSGGQLVGPVQDLGNGYYRQAVEYATAGEAPTVVVDLPGTGFTKPIDTSGRVPFPPPLPNWLCWLIVLLLLLLLLWCLLRRKHA